MATSFSDLYERAIFRFSDYDFMKFDVQLREDILHQYLMMAIPDVSEIVGRDYLAYDEDGFVGDISDTIQEILALGIDYYWFSAKVQNSELLRNQMSTKDFTYFSPANLMRELRNVRNDIKGEYNAAITMYSYRHGDFESLS